MLTGNISGSASVGGISIAGSITRTAIGGLPPVDTTLPAAVAGLLTRSDANTGVVTTGAAHGLTTGDKVNVFWTGGCRYGMDATVAGLAVTVDLGAGDELPADAATPVTIAEQVVINVPDFVGSSVEMIVMGCDQKAHVQLQETGAVEAWAKVLAAGERFDWADDTGVTNPLAGKTVVTIMASCGAITAGNLKISGLYNA